MDYASIYQKYGGFETFHRIIYELYGELFDHPEIFYHFIFSDPFTLSQLQAEYLCQAIGAPQMYAGRPIRAVHRKMKITPYEFDTVAQRFRQIFERNGFESQDVDFIMNFIGGHRDMIVTAESIWIDRLMRPIYTRVYRLRGLLKRGKKTPFPAWEEIIKGNSSHHQRESA